MFELINPRSGNYVTVSITGLPLTITGQVVTQPLLTVTGAPNTIIVLALQDGKSVSIDATKIAFVY